MIDWIGIAFGLAVNHVHRCLDVTCITMKTSLSLRATRTIVAASVVVVGLVTVLMSGAIGRLSQPGTSAFAVDRVHGQSAQVRGIIDLSPTPPEQSPFGTFPPTEIVDHAQARRQGVKLPTVEIDGWAIEIRKTPDGVFVTQLGERIFLTQMPIQADGSPWRLRVPQGARGEIHVASATVHSMPALGVSRPGEFTRLSWHDENFHYILVDFGGRWDLDEAIKIARSLK